MLKISKMADYATLVMVYCAEHAEQSWSASEIALKTHLNMPTVSKLLKKLLHVGLLTSMRGAQGGYQLARAPDSISVALIISAIDGPIALTECNHRAKHCELERGCGSRIGWQRINQAVESALNNVYLIDMMSVPIPLAIQDARFVI